MGELILACVSIVNVFFSPYSVLVVEAGWCIILFDGMIWVLFPPTFAIAMAIAMAMRLLYSSQAKLERNATNERNIIIR